MILVAYGTRPEWIKLEKLIKKLRENNEVRVLFTGQQKDIGEFEYDEFIDITERSGNRLSDIVSSILDSVVLDGVTKTVVQGDTASAFAVALASFHNQIPVVHIEAGLRTYNMEQPYPEESYRQMISSIATYHFCPTIEDTMNIAHEKKNGQAFTVGNTVIDNLPDLDISYTDDVLVTLHRRENHGELEKWFQELNKLAKKYSGSNRLNFILPLHPNPNVQKHKDILTHVDVIDPLPYPKMISLLARCKMVISDSGGIQEEAAFYQKKVLVCRKTTERPAGIGKNLIMVHSPEQLIDIFDNQVQDPVINIECPFGDGYSHIKIASILGELS